MSFTGNEDHSMTLEEAAELTANYRKNAGENAIKAGFFGQEALNEILKQEDCVGIRIYYGEESDGTPKLVLVGAKANEDDIISGTICEKHAPCPPYCGVANALNSDQ